MPVPIVSSMNATRIAELRRERGMTQEQLAEKSTVTTRTIQRLESGADVSLETLNLIANALDVQVRELFAEVGTTGLGKAVDELDARREVERSRRAEVTRGWRMVYPALGVAVSILVTWLIVGVGANPYLWILVGGYWVLGGVALRLLKTLVLDPWLDRRYPLTAAR